MRLPFLAVGAALPSPPPPPPTGPAIGVSSQSSESVATPLSPGVFGLSEQSQESVASPLNPVVLGLSEQSQESSGSYSVTGLSEQDQLSVATPLPTAIFALSQQSQESTATPDAGSVIFGNGYGTQFEIRLRATAPGAVTVANFLLPFAETIPEFRTVANGGLSQNSGLDFRFETAAGVKLGHVRADYNASTGRFAALVNIPNRNFSTEQSIFLYVGKASASEADAATARAGGWLAWYFGNSTTDQTGQSRTLTNNGVGSFALGAWPGGGFDGVADHFIGNNAAATWANGLAGITYVSFHKADRTDQKSEVFNVAGANAELSLHFNDTTDNRLTAVARYGASTLQYQSANQRQTTAAQAVGVAWEAGQPTRMVIDGALDVPASPSGVPAGTTTVTDTLEWGRGARGDLIYWDGVLSFLGFCNRALRTAELEQMTAAFIDPRLVYGISSANIATATNRAPVALRVDATGSSGVGGVINVTSSAFDPSGDPLSVSSAIVVSGSATVTLSGTSAILLTPSGTAAQQVVVEFVLSDGRGGTSVGRCYVTVPELVGASGLHLNPFNKTCYSHRPVGRGLAGARADLNPELYYGIPAAPAFTYFRPAAQGGPITFAATAARPNVQGSLGTLADFRIEGGDKFKKYTLVEDPSWTEYPVYDQSESRPSLRTIITNQKFPEEIKAIMATPTWNTTVNPKIPPQGDNDVNIYRPEADVLRCFFSIDWITSEGVFIAGRNVFRQFSLRGVGHLAQDRTDTQDGGSSASRIRFPGALLGYHEVISGQPINHVVHATASRKDIDARWQILSKNVIWPAAGADSSGWQPDQNLGDMPYGTLCVIRVQDWPLRNTIGLSALGRRLFDQLCFYGVRIMDGNGVASTTGGILQIRATGAQTPSLRWPGDLISEINAQYGLMQNLLWPVMNTRQRGAETENFTHPGGIILPYSAGGGPVDGLALGSTKCVNNAYDAPT